MFTINKIDISFGYYKTAGIARRLRNYGEKLGSHLDKGVRIALIRMFAKRFGRFRYGLSDIGGYGR